MSTAIDTVLGVLESATFQRLPKPLAVAGAVFDFDEAVAGTGVSHDLVVVGGPDADRRRLAQLLSGLSRRLDAVGSRRPLSLVLLGPRPSRGELAWLEVHARVLFVGSTNPTVEEVEQSIAVLLPFRIDSTSADPVAPLDELTSRLGGTLAADQRAFIGAAPSGANAVRARLQKYIDGALTDAEGGV